MEKPTSPAPCRCLPDPLIAAVADLAARTGRGFDETLCASVLTGLDHLNVHGSQMVVSLVDRVRGVLIDDSEGGHAY